ncbi:MAG: hypothetical protein IPM39_27465 [Chloroflexi bacterium]|nr:hypothetical protein [Chloroflexota bacterium]
MVTTRNQHREAEERRSRGFLFRASVPLLLCFSACLIFFTACATPPPTGSVANPAAYGTAGARMVSDSAATLQAATVQAFDASLSGTRQAQAATTQAQEIANATMGAMLVTRDAQDVRQRDLELAGMATATAVANQVSGTATAIALYRESLDVQHNAALVAQEAAARATAQARELERLQLENDMRRFWNNALPYLLGAITLLLLAGAGSLLFTRFMDARRPPLYQMAVTPNQLPMLKGPNGWQLLPARATILDQTAVPNAADNDIADGHFTDVSSARWDTFIRWQHVSQLPLGAIISGPRRPLLIDRNQEPHILVAGTSGSGKTRSGLMPTMLGLWAAGANVIVVNGAGSDFADLVAIPNITFFPPAEERDLIAPLADFLDATVRESLRRDHVLAAWNANTWRDLPAEAGESGELLIAVDEFLAVILAADEVKQAIRASRQYASQAEKRTAIEEIDHRVYRLWYAANRIASKNRKHGIHLLLSLTDPTGALLGDYGMALRRQCLAIAFRMRIADGSRKFLGVSSRDGYPQGSVGLPTGQYLANLGGEIHRCVSFFPSSADIRQFVQTRAPQVRQSTLPPLLQPPAVIEGQWEIADLLPAAHADPSLTDGLLRIEQDARLLQGQIPQFRNVTAAGRALSEAKGELGDRVNPPGRSIRDAEAAIRWLAEQGDEAAGWFVREVLE